MKRKIKKRHVDYSCGFPIVLLNVPLVKIQGEWILDIDYATLAKTVLIGLSKKSIPLTGNEIQFIRHFFNFTMREFAQRLGVKHTAVVKWEEKGDSNALITWGIEKDIRLLILDHLCTSHKDFREGYKKLATICDSIQTQSTKKTKIELFKLEFHDGYLEMAG